MSWANFPGASRASRPISIISKQRIDPVPAYCWEAVPKPTPGVAEAKAGLLRP